MLTRFRAVFLSAFVLPLTTTTVGCTEKTMTVGPFEAAVSTNLADGDDDDGGDEGDDDDGETMIADEFVPPTPLAELEIVKLLKQSGFPEKTIPRMVCTAKFESHFFASATNLNHNGTQDTGLFQINDIWLAGCGLTRTALLGPEANARCAYKVWKAQGLTAWVAYKHKRRTCQKYRVAQVSEA